MNSVLSASYADIEIKDALHLMDERGVKNTAATRRKLRGDVQRDVIECNGDVIKEFGGVSEQLKRIGATLQSLNAQFSTMKAHITTATQEAAPVLEEAAELLQRKSDSEAKSALLSAFRSHFLISEDDLAILTSTALPVNSDFFRILTRAKGIRSDCTVLLTDEAHSRLGTEILERATSALDLAYGKLHRWTTKEFRALNLENPSLNRDLRQSLKTLAERPELFQSCLDAFAAAREQSLADGFYTALTGYAVNGGRVEGIKAIEESAWEPVRYVGDMCAWVHSAAVSEREALEVLFLEEGEEISANIARGREAEPWKYRSGSPTNPASESDDEEEEREETVFDSLKALNQLVDRALANTAHTLSTRISAILHSGDSPLLLYNIAHTLSFYTVMFLKLLPEESNLIQLLNTLQHSAFTQFQKLCHVQIMDLEAEAGELDVKRNNLRLPSWFQDALDTLKELLKTLDSGISSPAVREVECEAVIEAALEPYEELASKAAEGLGEKDKAVFGMNWQMAVVDALKMFNSVPERRIQGVEKEFERSEQGLRELQLEWLFTESGMKDLFSTIESQGENADVEKLAQLPVFRPESLEDTGRRLDMWLPSALMYALENLGQMESERLAREITEECVEQFCEKFERLERTLMDMPCDEPATEEEGTDSEDEMGRGLRRYFPRTSGEIRVLLS